MRFPKVLGCMALLAVLGLAQAAPASAFTLEPPAVTSHGKTERNPCFRGGYEDSGDAVAVIDPAPCRLQRPRPEPLPVHRAGRVLVGTAEAALRVHVTVRSRAGIKRFRAVRRDESRRRWSFRMPRFKNGSRLGLRVVYRDGHTAWSLPLKRHRHAPIYCPHTGDTRFDANRLLGVRLDRGRRIARRHDCTVRVIKRDGRALVVTDDLRPDRINVVVRDGRIVRIAGVY